MLQFISGRCENGEQVQADCENEDNADDVSARSMVANSAEDEAEIVEIMNSGVTFAGLLDKGAALVMRQRDDVSARVLWKINCVTSSTDNRTVNLRLDVL